MPHKKPAFAFWENRVLIRYLYSSYTNRSLMILHVCSLNEWKALEEEYYVPFAFQAEGFIHCCLEHQLPGVRQRYFRNRTDLLLLRIDESLLEADVKYEMSPAGELFPHVYGVIHKKAVTSVENLN